MTNANIEQAQRTIYLLSAHINARLTPKEETELDKWLGLSMANKELFDRLKDPHYREEILKTWNPNAAEDSFKRLKGKMVPEKRWSLWPRIAVVAAAVAAITLGTWLFAGNDDIAPGKNIAILTLANGKKITLSEAKTGVMINAGKQTNALKLTYNDGTSLGDRHPELVSEPQSGKVNMLTVNTPRGGTYQIILSDGTRVWLNAASTLQFPSTFDKLTRRKVILNGEAYFEVGKDKLHPFIVESRGQQVEVLGTHFNISDYANESAVKTTLLEGSVKIHSFGNTALLKPGQQAQLKSGQIHMEENIDLEDVVAWKNGYFKFNEDLETIMNKVSRWYNVEVIYEYKPSSDETFSGKISRSKDISALLKIIEFNGDVHFKIEGRRVIVMK